MLAKKIIHILEVTLKRNQDQLLFIPSYCYSLIIKFKWGLRQNFEAISNMSNEQNVKIVSIDDKMYVITEEVSSSDFNQISQVVHDEVDEGGQDDDLGFWSQHDNALRDLLVFLVQKHSIEDVMDSKMKSQCWVSLS